MTDRGQIRPPCRLADSHDNVDWAKLITQLTENFSNRTLHQGPGNRAGRGMPAHHYSQTGLFLRLLVSDQNDKKPVLPPGRE